MNRPVFAPAIKLSILVLAFMGLYGCASMSAEECLTADWHTIGYEDGIHGLSTSNISNRRKACAKHGVSPDLEQYTAGHAKGVPLYCVARTGFSRGSRGSQYPAICPASVFPEFDKAYNIGLRAHEIQKRINRLQSEYNHIDHELADLQHRIETNEDQIVADDTEPRTRRDLMAQNKELELIANGMNVDLLGLSRKMDSLKRRKDSIRY